MSARYLKAYVGALIAGLTAVAASIEDGLTSSEILTAIIAALVALAGVWAVPNADRADDAGFVNGGRLD